MSIEHIETGQTTQATSAAKPKQTDGGGFAALFASLSAELRSGTGLSPDLALPQGAASQSSGVADGAPTEDDRNAAPDRDDDSSADSADTDTESQAADDRDYGRAGDDDRHNGPASHVADHMTAPDIGTAGTTDPNDAAAGPVTAAARTMANGNDNAATQTSQTARTNPATQTQANPAANASSGGQEFNVATTGREATQTSNTGAHRSNATADANLLNAQVTDQGGRVSSQPTANLAASATVNAQLGRGAKATDAAMQDGALPFEEFASLRGERFAAQGAIKPGANGTMKSGGDATPASDMGSRNSATPQPPVIPAAPQTPVPPPVMVNTGTSAGGSSSTAQTMAGQTADPGLNTSGATGSTIQSDASTRARSTAFASHMRPAPQHPPTAEQVAVQIQRAVGAGTDRITIQLRPQELGRVEVKMEVGHDGKLQAVISADKPETLELLQRDQRSLQQALNNAGLDVSSGSLSFNLNGQHNDQAMAGDADGKGASESQDDDEMSETLAADNNGHVNIITDDKIDVVL